MPYNLLPPGTAIVVAGMQWYAQVPSLTERPSARARTFVSMHAHTHTHTCMQQEECFRPSSQVVCDILEALVAGPSRFEDARQYIF